MTTPSPNIHIGVGTRNEKFEFPMGPEVPLGGFKFVDAGAGDDYIFAAKYIGVFYGGLGSDVIFASGTIFGDMNDVDDSAPVLPGENDVLMGWQWGDTIFGARGNDRIFGVDGNDFLNGGAGSDTISGGTGNDAISGGAGDDALYAGSETEPRYAVPFFTHNGIDDQPLTVTQVSVLLPAFESQNNGGYADTVDGGAGNDTIYLDDGADIAYGGSGDDRIFGGSGENLIDGGTGNDVLSGGAGIDTMSGGSGSDHYVVDNALDLVIENQGGGIDLVQTYVNYRLPDWVENLTGPSADAVLNLTLIGNGLANTIWGNAGENFLQGLDGNDTIMGGGGADWIHGGLGNDQLSGGAGADRFMFNTHPHKSLNVDHILDFSVRDDTVYLDNAVFTKVGPAGWLSSKAFVKGARAKDASDRVIYNNKTGDLFYDADGAGGKTQVKIAQTDKNLALTQKDFFVI